MNSTRYRRVMTSVLKPFKPFIIEVESGSDNKFTIPTTGGGYNYSVKTSDGQTFTGVTGNLTITFPNPNTHYDVEISGLFPRIYFNNDSERLKIKDTKQWGAVQWTSMYGAFYGCSNMNVTATDVPNLSSVTNMGNMFYNCQSLTSLDVSNWDVSSVTNMQQMFQQCSSLTSLDVSNWNVSSVTNMSYMFRQCTSLTSLDVSNWNVSSVTNMSYMFQQCSSLTSLDVSNWDVSSVTNMQQMFRQCTSLTSLDVSNWNVSSVTNMSIMFYNCQSLTTLDVSNWNVSSVTNMGNMFYNCQSLTTLDVSNWDVSSVTSMNGMFQSSGVSSNIDFSDPIRGSIALIDSNGMTGYSNIKSLKLQAGGITNAPNAYEYASTGLIELLLINQSVNILISRVSSTFTGTAIDDLGNSVADMTGQSQPTITMTTAQYNSGIDTTIWTNKNWAIAQV